MKGVTDKYEANWYRVRLMYDNCEEMVYSIDPELIADYCETTQAQFERCLDMIQVNVPIKNIMKQLKVAYFIPPKNDLMYVAKEEYDFNLDEQTLRLPI